MPKSPFNNLPEQENPEGELPDSQNIAQQLEQIERSHSHRSELTKLEIWALVSTMDDFIPGFWSRFMVNRQLAFKEFLEQRKAKGT